MKKLLLIVNLCCLALFAATAQQAPCNFGHLIEERQAQDPNYANEMQQLEQQVQTYLQNNTGAASARGGVRTVSVAVHVVYNTSAENVSTTSINNMINTLNRDYRNQLATSGNTRAQFLSVAGDAQIEFCLDTIVRRNTSVTCFDPNSNANGMKSNNTGGSTPLDTRYYLNIWIVDLCGNTGGGVAGYAYLPTTGIPGSSIDGLVIDYSLGYDNGNGGTATHEIGHYFGLQHPWGSDNNPSCSTDDGFSDTPNSDGPNYTCNGSEASCGSTDMVENHMDYSFCPTMFSAEQVAYMNAVLTQVRSTLLNSPGCNNSAGGAPSAAFSADRTTICAGEAIAFTDNSTGNPTSWSWSFTGGSPSSSTTQNPSITYNTPGTYTVSLTATNANGTDTETKTAYITVRTPLSLPLVEGFQGSFVPADWELVNPDGSFTWERTTAAGSYGASSASMYINNYDYNAAGSEDVIITPVYDFTNITNAQLTFDLAYAEYDASSPDTLLVIVTPDCGANYYLLEEFGGPSMNTAGGYVTGAFTPTSGQWRTDTIDLSALAGFSDVQFGFLSITGYGNNLYLDNINIATPPVNQAPVANFIGAPTTVTVGGTVNFTDQSTNSPTSWSWSFAGGSPASSTAQNPTGIQYNNVGTYAVTLTATNTFGNDTETKTAYINVVQGGGTGACATLTNVGANDTLTLYLAGQTGTGGYLSGHNQYGDKAKADKYTGILPNSTVDSVFTYFGVAKDGGNNGTVQVTIWDADGTGGEPGTILGSTPVPISSLNTTGLSGVVFNPPITVNGDFYAGVQLSYAPGDTVAIVTNRIGAMATGTGTAWEQWDDNTWHSYTDAYTADLAHVIFVNVCEPGSSPNLPVADFTAAQTTGCPGTTVNFNNTSTNATSYAWTFTGGTPSSSTSASPTVTYNTAGTYSVTLVASNASGSDTETKTGLITINASPSLNFSTTPVTCNGGDDGAVDISATGGASPYTYLWNTGATTTDLRDLVAGTYTVTVTDDNGCTVSGNTQVSQPTAINVSATTTSSTCGAANGSATASATGGASPYTYLWSTAATTASINNLLPGTYTVTVTDDNGCTALGSAILGGGQAVVVTVNKTDATCAGNDGSATASATGGSGSYTYNWSNTQAGATISNLAAGTYTVTVNDGAGCTGTSSVTISAPSAFTLSTSSTNASCGVSDGSATVTPNGGSAPYTYTWSNTGNTATISSVAAGSYSVTVSDAGGCTVSTSVSVNNTGGPSVSVASQTNVLCAGASTGSITVSASGGTTPYTYSWSGSGSITATASNLSAGTYTVTITDAAGCVATANATITAPTALSLNTSSVSNVTCFGGNDGSASVSASGGVAPYTITWSSAATGASANNLAAGSYSVTVVDANNCSATTSLTVTEPTQLSISLTRSNPGCATANGSATATVTGGVGPYTYVWSNAATTNPATALSAGSYTVTATDDNGCTVVGNVTLSNASGPSVSTTSTPVSCGATNDGSATATATGGATPYTYLWTDGTGNQVGSSATASGLVSGTYNYTVSDANGCDAVGTVTVSSQGPDLDETINDVTGCFGNNNGSINLTVTGGTSPYNYAWSNGQSTRNIAALIAGNYTVTAVDNSGCSVVETFTVGGPTEIVPGATVTDATTSTSTDGSATVNPTGGTPPYTVTWSTSATGNAALNLAPGSYTVAVTDANGCTRTETFIVGVSTGINDVKDAISLSIYPNPTSGIVNVDIELNTTADVNVDVYNMVGERVIEVKALNVSNNTVQLDMTDLPEAAYFIRVSSGSNVVNSKLLKLNQ